MIRGLTFVQSYKSAVSTRGLGGHVTGNTAPDALMSQGSIEASAAGQFVASVNVSLVHLSDDTLLAH